MFSRDRQSLFAVLLDSVRLYLYWRLGRGSSLSLWAFLVSVIRFLCSAQRVMDLPWPCSVTHLGSSLSLRSGARLGASLSVSSFSQFGSSMALRSYSRVEKFHLVRTFCPWLSFRDLRIVAVLARHIAIRRILICDRLLNSGGIGVSQKFPRPWRFACSFHRFMSRILGGFEVCALVNSNGLWLMDLFNLA